MTQSLIVIQSSIKSLLATTAPLSLVDESSLPQATHLLSEANSLLDSLTANKKADLEPYETPAKQIKKEYEPSEKALKFVIDSLRSSIGAYQTKVAQLAKLEEEKIAKRILPGKGNLSLETATKKFENIEKPVEKVVTQAGSLTFRPKNTLKIIDSTKIPREYLVPDEVAILTALEAGVVIPGAVIEIIQVPYNKRN